MRDRLIELLKKADEYASGVCTDYDEAQEVCADYLLAEGVIVPPCKVGQTVFCIRYDKLREPFVKPLGVLSVTTHGKGRFIVFTTKEDIWGVTAFATAQEAEEKLKEAGK